MNNDYQSELFRLAVVLYADNNYEVTSKTVNKKIIESVLVECGKREFSIHEIIDFIQERYNLIFDEESIIEIVDNPKYEFLTNQRDGNTYVCLSAQRRQNLDTKINNKTIDYFISEFQKEYAELVKNTDSKSIIYKFIYEIFVSNSAGFQKLIDNTKNITELTDYESINYSDKEKEIINNFLQWDNPEKNKTIFDIASYSVEYCMLTNKSGKHSIHLTDLRNKNFYLDTNIIYRGLGINGEDRRKRSSTFLKKFNEAGEKLIISKATDTEFRDGIKGHIDRISKHNSPRVNSKLYQEVAVQKDIFNFYHKWRIGKVNTNLELFLAYVLGLYDSFIKEFNIEVERIVQFNPKDKKTDEILKEYSSSIYNFKSQNRSEVIGSSVVDAENIFLIEYKRDGKSHNMFETKFFLISTDQSLRKWDYLRSNSTPVVLLPSQWLSVILRYVNRTDDDYKSFVSFLNLKNNEVLIDNEKLQIVLAGISEMTNDIQQQRNILNNLVENKFNGVISKDISGEQLFDNAKKYAKSKLEEEIEALKKSKEEIETKHDALAKDHEKNKKQVKVEIQEISSENKDLNKKLSLVENKNITLKEELREKYKDEKLKKWKRSAYWLIPIVFLILLFYYFQLFHSEWEHNYIEKLVRYIDNIQSDTKKDWIRFIINGGLLGGLGSLVVFIYNRIFSKSKKTKKEEEIMGNMPEQYR